MTPDLSCGYYVVMGGSEKRRAKIINSNIDDNGNAMLQSFLSKNYFKKSREMVKGGYTPCCFGHLEV